MKPLTFSLDEELNVKESDVANGIQ
jgi:hypothetical protein